jgi:hypothetical protein
MATHQFRVEDDRDPDAPPKPRSWMSGCLIGCLVVVVVVLLLGVLATLWVARNGKSWLAQSVSAAVKESINETDLPAEEKAEINAEIDRATNAFRDGRMSNEQAVMLMQGLAQSPLITAIVASAAEKKYVDPSGLSDEEKTAANLTLQRFARGVIDRKINEQTYESVMSNIATRQGDQWQLRDKVTDEQLRAFLTAAKTAADEAGVAAEPPQIDPSDEVKRLIDDAISGKAPPAIEMPPSPAKIPAEPPAETGHQPIESPTE